MEYLDTSPQEHAKALSCCVLPRKQQRGMSAPDRRRVWGGNPNKLLQGAKGAKSEIWHRGRNLLFSQVYIHLLCLLFSGDNGLPGLPVRGNRERVNRYVGDIRSILVCGSVPYQIPVKGALPHHHQGWRWYCLAADVRSPRGRDGDEKSLSVGLEIATRRGYNKGKIGKNSIDTLRPFL